MTSAPFLPVGWSAATPPVDRFRQPPRGSCSGSRWRSASTSHRRALSADRQMHGHGARVPIYRGASRRMAWICEHDRVAGLRPARPCDRLARRPPRGRLSTSRSLPVCPATSRRCRGGRREAEMAATGGNGGRPPAAARPRAPCATRCRADGVRQVRDRRARADRDGSSHHAAPVRGSPARAPPPQTRCRGARRSRAGRRAFRRVRDGPPREAAPATVAARLRRKPAAPGSAAGAPALVGGAGAMAPAFALLHGAGNGC